jgi:hypothetical protein
MPFQNDVISNWRSHRVSAGTCEDCGMMFQQYSAISATIYMKEDATMMTPPGGKVEPCRS